MSGENRAHGYVALQTQSSAVRPWTWDGVGASPGTHSCPPSYVRSAPRASFVARGTSVVSCEELTLAVSSSLTMQLLHPVTRSVNWRVSGAISRRDTPSCSGCLSIQSTQQCGTVGTEEIWIECEDIVQFFPGIRRPAD